MGSGQGFLHILGVVVVQFLHQRTIKGGLDFQFFECVNHDESTYQLEL